MVESRFLSRAILLVSVSITLCGTGCQDQQKIAKQTEAVQQRVEELRAQRDAAEEPTSSLKSHPIARKGKKAVDSAIDTMRSEVAVLEERKKTLELEVAALQKDFAEYRAKNP
jgi:cell division protein FtsB